MVDSLVFLSCCSVRRRAVVVGGCGNVKLTVDYDCVCMFACFVCACKNLFCFVIMTHVCISVLVWVLRTHAIIIV